MPELPEVETVRRGLHAVLPGRRVREIQLRRRDLRWPIPVDAVQALVGRRCLQVERRAKYLLLRFDGIERPTALVHLGMSGRLFVTRAQQAPVWRPHEHWRLRSDRFWLRYVDPRRFGVLDVVPAQQLAAHRLLRDLGVEPLLASFDGDWLFARSRRRRASIKSLLMDSKEIAGVGNIYASEACHRAGVRPGRAAGRLSRDECTRLARSVRDVLRAAIRAGGTTLRDYIGVDENGGWFQRALRVYGKAGEACGACGSVIRRRSDHGRMTYWCPGCQR